MVAAFSVSVVSAEYFSNIETKLQNDVSPGPLRLIDWSSIKTVYPCRNKLKVKH
jgi:hypothetical protein